MLHTNNCGRSKDVTYYFEFFLVIWNAYKGKNQLRSNKFKIPTWDAGWWQIRNVLVYENLADDILKEIKIAHSALKEKFLQQVYDYKFLV